MTTAARDEQLSDGVVAGILARFQLAFDPRRVEGEGAALAVLTWQQALEGIDQAMAEAAAQHVLRDPDRAGPAGFPSPGQFRQLALQLYRQRQADVGRSEGTVCMGCRGTELEWHVTVKHAITDEQGAVLWPEQRYEAVAPCRVCRPDDFAYLRAGHQRRDHDLAACDHERCQRRREHRRGRHG